MREIVVVGDVVVDVVARALTPLVHGSDTAADVRVTSGGAGGNVAAWLAAAGAVVTLVARVGDDLAGRGQAAMLADLGVRCALTFDGAVPTGTIVAVVDAAGERTFLTDRGAAGALAAGDVPAVAPASHVHVSGYALLHEASRAAGLRALAVARAAGCTTSVDPASVEPLRAAGVERFREWMRGVDVLLPNAAEARLLTGAATVVEAARALAGSHPVVAVTDGARGAVWAAGEDAGHARAEPTTVLDTTGAGDAFTAGFLAAWTGGSSVDAATVAGVRLAARAVSHLGARPRLG